METQELIELFKSKGLEKAKENGNSWISTQEEFLYEFLDGAYVGLMPDGFELKVDNSKEAYDSYGSEDSSLDIIVKHTESGRYLSVRGIRQSYSGTEISGVEEVKPKQVVTTIFE